MAAIRARRRGTHAVLGRFDARMLAGLILAVVTTSTAFLLWDGAERRVPVLVAARDLATGQVVADADLQVARVQAPPAQQALLLGIADRERAVGRVVTAPIAAGELLVAARLGTGPLLGPDDAAITVAAPADRIYPGLRPGDAVAVYATRDPGKTTSQTAVLLERVTVHAVAAEAGVGSVTRTAAGAEPPRRLTSVTLRVPRADAERLVHAAVSGELTIVLLSVTQKGP